MDDLVERLLEQRDVLHTHSPADERTGGVAGSTLVAVLLGLSISVSPASSSQASCGLEAFGVPQCKASKEKAEKAREAKSQKAIASQLITLGFFLNSIIMGLFLVAPLVILLIGSVNV